jgi:hypothetical protein
MSTSTKPRPEAITSARNCGNGGKGGNDEGLLALKDGSAMVDGSNKVVSQTFSMGG